MDHHDGCTRLVSKEKLVSSAKRKLRWTMGECCDSANGNRNAKGTPPVDHDDPVFWNKPGGPVQTPPGQERTPSRHSGFHLARRESSLWYSDSTRIHAIAIIAFGGFRALSVALGSRRASTRYSPSKGRWVAVETFLRWRMKNARETDSLRTAQRVSRIVNTTAISFVTRFAVILRVGERSSEFYKVSVWHVSCVVNMEF